jgi:hypothetical protein
MPKLISASIDVKRINKDRLYKGEKGTYLKITLSLNEEKDKYGNNASIWEEQSKEEREAKKERNYLGNGKIIFESIKGNSEDKNFTVEPASQEDDMPF